MFNLLLFHASSVPEQSIQMIRYSRIFSRRFQIQHPPSYLALHHLDLLTFEPLFTMATSMDTLPAHLLPLVMEEFPQSLATACVCRSEQREPRLRCLQCGIIEEEEEDCSTLEEDQARRSFLQTVESLRRSTRWAPWEELLAWNACSIWLPCDQFGNQQMSKSGPWTVIYFGYTAITDEEHMRHWWDYAELRLWELLQSICLKELHKMAGSHLDSYIFSKVNLFCCTMIFCKALTLTLPSNYYIMHKFVFSCVYIACCCKWLCLIYKAHILMFIGWFALSV